MNPKTHKLFALSSPISSPFSLPPSAPETGFGRRLKEVAFRGATGHASGLVEVGRVPSRGSHLCREEFPRCRGGARAGATLEMFFDGFFGLGFSGAIYIYIYITLSDTSYLFHNI